jgi:hypothetical protein
LRNIINMYYGNQKFELFVLELIGPNGWIRESLWNRAHDFKLEVNMTLRIKRTSGLIVSFVLFFSNVTSCLAADDTYSSTGMPVVSYYFAHTADEGLPDATGHGYNATVDFSASHSAWKDVEGQPVVQFSAEQDKIEMPYRAFPGTKGRVVMSVLIEDLNADQTLWSVETSNDSLALIFKESRLSLLYYNSNTKKEYKALAPVGCLEMGKWYNIIASWDLSDSLEIVIGSVPVCKVDLNIPPNFSEEGVMLIGNNKTGLKTFQGLVRSFELWSQPVSLEAVDQLEKKFEPEDVVTLKNSYLSLNFAKDSLVPAGAQAIETSTPLLCDTLLPDEMLLWRIEFMTELGKGRSYTLDNKSKASDKRISKKNTAAGQQMKLYWDGLSLPGVEEAVNVVVTVDLPDDSQFSYWKIGVKSSDEKWALWNVDFPIVHFSRPVKDEIENTYLALPYRWGLLLSDPFYINSKDKSEKQRIFGYPSNMHMQFFGIYGDGGGIYVGTYDSEGYTKDHLMTALPARERIRHRIRNYPFDRGSGVYDFELSYPFVLGTFKGDWYDACQIYRKWALQQPWCGKGPLVTRKDVPEWLKNSPLFLKNVPAKSRPLANNIAGSTRMLEEFGPNISSMWYNWWERVPEKSAVDLKYFELIPGNYGQWVGTHDGLVEALEKLREKGLRSFAYIQSKCYDQGNEPLNDDAKLMSPWAIHSINGEKSLYNNTAVSTWVMCRASKPWQDRFIALSEKAIRDYNFSGIYLDSFGRNSRECYDPDHGHELGTGVYRLAGQHRMAERLRKAIRKIDSEACTTSEAPIEFFIDVIDTKLLHFNVLENGCPLWQTVYHDYQLSYGRSIARGGPSMDRTDWKGLEDVFRMKAGNLFIMGASIGRVYAFQDPPFPFAKIDEHQLAFLKQLVKLKADCKEFLTLGKALRPAKINPDPEPFYAVRHISRRNSVQKMQLPSVATSSWRAYDGRAAIVLLNYTRDPKEIEIEFNAAEYGFAEGSELEVLRRSANGTKQLTPITAGKTKMNVLLGSTQAIILELSSM